MTRIIAISNQKGGVGKTTTTEAMAAALKKLEYKILAIDLDPQANLSDSIGADTRESITIYDLMSKRGSVNDAIQHLTAFDIIPAPSDSLLVNAEHEFSKTGKEYMLREIIAPIVNQYDYILIDTPPSLGVLTVNALTAADEVIIPATAGKFAANGIYQLSKTIQDVKQYCNPKLQISGILMTKFKSRTNIGREMREIIEEIGNLINVPIFKTFIRDSVTVDEAQANSVDIFEYKSKSVIVEDYSSFINEYLSQKEQVR